MAFKCSAQQGAFVFMNAFAEETMMHSSTRLVPFIKNNIDRWHEHAIANDELRCAKKEIIFVCGMIKTDDWGLGAFTNWEKGDIVSFVGQVPFCEGAFSAHAQDGRVANVETRTKPRPSNASFASRPNPLAEGTRGSMAPSRTSQSDSVVQMADVKRDQTLFLHYYKIKNRFWLLDKVMRAAAGPDERDSDRTGDGEHDAVGVHPNEATDGEKGLAVDEVSISALCQTG